MSEKSPTGFPPGASLRRRTCTKRRGWSKSPAESFAVLLAAAALRSTMTHPAVTSVLLNAAMSMQSMHRGPRALMPSSTR